MLKTGSSKRKWVRLTGITFWFTNLTSAPWSIFKSNCADSNFIKSKSAFVQIADKSILLDQRLVIFWISFQQINSEPITFVLIPTKDNIRIMMFSFKGLFAVQSGPWISVRLPSLVSGRNNPILGEQVLEDHLEGNQFSLFLWQVQKRIQKFRPLNLSTKTNLTVVLDFTSTHIKRIFFKPVFDSVQKRKLFLNSPRFRCDLKQ